MLVNVLYGSFRIEISMQSSAVDAVVLSSDVRDSPVHIARAYVARANLDQGISDQGFVGGLPAPEIDVVRSPIDPVQNHVSAGVAPPPNPPHAPPPQYPPVRLPA